MSNAVRKVLKLAEECQRDEDIISEVYDVLEELLDEEDMDDWVKDRINKCLGLLEEI